MGWDGRYGVGERRCSANGTKIILVSQSYPNNTADSISRVSTQNRPRKLATPKTTPPSFDPTHPLPCTRAHSIAYALRNPLKLSTHVVQCFNKLHTEFQAGRNTRTGAKSIGVRARPTPGPRACSQTHDISAHVTPRKPNETASNLTNTLLIQPLATM